MENLDRLATEQSNPRTVEIDILPTVDALMLLNDEDRDVPEAVRRVIPAIGRAVDRVVEAMREGGRLVYVGAGTSGRLGCLDASEIPPTYGMDPGRVVGLIAGGDGALRRSIEGAEDSRDLGAEDLRALNLTPADVVCGVAASGRTPYVLGALEYARSIGAATLGLTTNSPSEMDDAVDILMAPVVGPEPISGSTRMKSGTAQKLVLNMLSSMVMVRLGKTYGNLMVDVRPTNAKLVHRAHRLIGAVTGVDAAEAERLLIASGNEVKLAILMGLTGLDRDTSLARLSRAEGVLRRVKDS